MSAGITRRIRRLLIVPLALVAMALGAGQASAATLPVGGSSQMLFNWIYSPNSVPGANDWNCKPGADHPVPVVLVHATAFNLGSNWVALSPTLKNAGYCVYALNYGMTTLSYGRAGGLGDIAESAKALSAFVDKVRTSTGASKVDIVGHSQGGMMPNYYIKRLGGASKVRTLVGLAPSNHGTTFSGLTTLSSSLGMLGTTVRSTIETALANPSLAPALPQQLVGSAFQTALFGDGDTVPGVRYVVIETNRDLIVTPYTNAFLTGANVTNILIQKQCPGDKVGHVGLALDSPTLQNVLNQLGAASPTFQPACKGYGLSL